MPTRDVASFGAPCWADIWTSDVEGSRLFYSRLFGWEAQEPSSEFGGYFMFTHDGAPVAGGMGDMGDMRADNSWKIYLATDDIEKTVETARAEGATIISPPMQIADLGSQAVLTDTTGAHLGAWQPGTFQGFTTINEPGTPSWFELHTRDHARALSFYRNVFRYEVNSVSDTEAFRYSILRDESSDRDLAGIMDASSFLPEGTSAHWSVYWEVADVDRSLEKVVDLGGSIVEGPYATPYGLLATVADPAGAAFKLRTPN